MGSNDPIYRVLDANFNRAGEALRVVEDHSRFGLNHAATSHRLKQMRHELGSLVRGFDQERLLRARDVANDPGTGYSTPTEMARAGTHAIVSANFRRLTEALRSIEEAAKTVDPLLARRAEALRYQAYQIEAEVSALEPRTRLEQAHLMLIFTRAQCHLDPARVIDQVYAAGVRVFQLREKGDASGEDDGLIFERLGASINELRGREDVVILVNDRADMALALGAHGVHLGRLDLPIQAARRVLGTAAMIGRSARTMGELNEADGADYIGAGAMYATSSKAGTSPGGPEWGKQATQASRLPVFCIGGVNEGNVRALVHNGISRVAVGAGICGSATPGKAAQAILAMLKPVDK